MSMPLFIGLSILGFSLAACSAGGSGSTGTFGETPAVLSAGTNNIVATPIPTANSNTATNLGNGTTTNTGAVSGAVGSNGIAGSTSGDITNTTTTSAGTTSTTNGNTGSTGISISTN